MKFQKWLAIGGMVGIPQPQAEGLIYGSRSAAPGTRFRRAADPVRVHSYNRKDDPFRVQRISNFDPWAALGRFAPGALPTATTDQPFRLCPTPNPLPQSSWSFVSSC